MRNRRTDRRSRSRTEIIATAIIFLGVVIMAIALYFGTADSLNTAQNTMERHISDLKKQCNDYDEFLTSDKIKSLMRLTEQAEDVGIHWRCCRIRRKANTLPYLWKASGWPAF